MTDAEILSALDDAQIVALTMIGEARGEDIEGRIAVACVIRNRVLDERWAEDYKGVCLQKSQFSCWNQSDPNRKVLIETGRSLVTGCRPPIDLDGRLLIEALWIAKGVIDGVLARDRTLGANHYLTRKLWETNPPSWVGGARVGALVGRHAFFKL